MSQNSLHSTGLAAISVRRGVTTMMLFLLVMGFGVFSLGRLGLDLFPDISFPTVIVITGYTGASPEDIETLVTKPLEGAVSSVKDVEEVHSTSKQGASVIMAKFDWGKDMEVAETHVRRALGMVRGFLPEDVDEPMVFAFDPALQPIVMMMITGPYPLDELRHIATKEIEPRLVRLPGVAQANIEGGLAREIHVVLDPTKIAAYGLNVNQVIGAVYQENVQVPGGALEQGALDFTIQAKGKYQKVSDIGEVVVGMKLDTNRMVPLTLKEVAKVEDSFVESQRVLEVDGIPAVWIMARKQSGANTVTTAKAVMSALPQIKREIAADIDFRIIFNQADFINLALGNLSETGIIGVIITFLVLLLLLRNLRAASIVALAIPASVIATFSVMDSMGMTLNMMSMAGLALGIGMLVDNAVVVTENIFRLRQEGKPSWEAAIEGAKTVTLAVTASTLTTVVVFVPVLFVPGIAGVIFKDMAVTICFSLLVSLVVSLTIVPLAASRLFTSERATQLLERSRGRDPLLRIRGHYLKALEWALDRRGKVWVSLGVATVLTVVVWSVLPTEFVAHNDQSMVEIAVESAVGTSLPEATANIRQVTEIVEKTVSPAERKMVGIDAGVGTGFMAIFSKGVHAGVVRMPLVAIGERERSQAQIEDAIRGATRALPGIKVTVGQQMNMMGGNGDLEIQLRGHDLEISRLTGLELRDSILKMPEVAEASFSMDDQKPEVRVRFDRVKMAQVGLSTAAVGNAISTYFMGRIAGRFAEGGDEYDILVRYAKEHRMDLDEIRRMPVATPDGSSVPLGNVADLSVGLGPVDVTRLDQERLTRINVNLKDEYVDAEGSSHRKDLGASIKRIDEFLAKYTWPKDFSYHIGGSAEDFLTSFSYLGLALLISIFLVYMVMASQFESFRQPFIVIFTVPLAAVGVVLAFVVTRATVDVSALIGVIMLAGVVVNNGIVLVDAANQLREQGEEKRRAIVHACSLRLRPVILTAATTVLAMLPLALGLGAGSETWRGMAIAVIGGLTVATLLTLFVVPVMYTIFAPKHVEVTRAAGEAVV